MRTIKCLWFGILWLTTVIFRVKTNFAEQGGRSCLCVFVGSSQFVSFSRLRPSQSHFVCTSFLPRPVCFDSRGNKLHTNHVFCSSECRRGALYGTEPIGRSSDSNQRDYLWSQPVNHRGSPDQVQVHCHKYTTDTFEECKSLCERSPACRAIDYDNDQYDYGGMHKECQMVEQGTPTSKLSSRGKTGVKHANLLKTDGSLGREYRDGWTSVTSNCLRNAVVILRKSLIGFEDCMIACEKNEECVAMEIDLDNNWCKTYAEIGGKYDCNNVDDEHAHGCRSSAVYDRPSRPKPSVNCQVDDWLAWSGCHATCGPSVRTRSRVIVQNAVGKGDPCPETTQTENCSLGDCVRECRLITCKWKPCVDGSKIVCVTKARKHDTTK